MIMTWMAVNMGTLPVFLIPSVDQKSLRRQGCRERETEMGLHIVRSQAVLSFTFIYFVLSPLCWDSSHFLPICFLSACLPSALSLLPAVRIVITWTMDSPVGNLADLFYISRKFPTFRLNSNTASVQMQMISWTPLWVKRNIKKNLLKSSVKVTGKHRPSPCCHMRLASFVTVNVSVQYFV